MEKCCSTNIGERGKRGIKSCTNYQRIKLMSHAMKLWEKVLEQRFRQKTKISKNKFGFMPGKPTMDTMFSVRQLPEKLPKEEEKPSNDLHQSREIP